jgi:DNA polymerase III delta prime subunit
MGHDGCVGRLLLVEGIPGSGKTTTAQSAARWLVQAGDRVAVYCEGGPQPADLAWQWWLAPTEFGALCRAHPGVEAELRRCAWVGAAGVAVAYTKVDVDRCGGQWPDVEAAMQRREPFNGSVPVARFMDILAARWSEFGASGGSPDAVDVVVFDGAFLQNTLVELVLFAERDATAITRDLCRLAESVAALQAYLAYRQQLEAEVLPRLPLEWVDLASPVGTTALRGPFEEQLTALLAGLIRSGP